MKIKFNKAAFGHKIDQEIEVTDVEAKAFGDAVVEVTPTVEDVASKAATELLDSVDARIQIAVDSKVSKAVADALNKAVKGRPVINVGPDRSTLDPKGGFANFGSFAKAVMSSKVNNKADERLVHLKAGMNEGDGVPQDGQYAVPTEYAKEIFAIIMSEQSLLPKTRNYVTNTAYFKLPIDNLVTIGTNPIGGSWISPDNTALNISGSGFVNQLSFTLSKYGVLVSVTDELLSDNDVLLEQFLTAKAGYAITYAVNQAIVQGTGVNQPTGIIGNAATVVVTAQNADEYVSGSDFTYKDLSAMLAVFLRTNSPSPVWLVNKSLLNNLYNLKDDSGRNLYYAPGTIQQTPSGTMLGIPVMESFHCATAGSPGDIILADMSAYITATKGSGVEAATSMHLYFNQDAMAFRFTFRIDGKPGLAQPLKDPNYATNNTKYSPFVVLGSRT